MWLKESQPQFCHEVGLTQGRLLDQKFLQRGEMPDTDRRSLRVLQCLLPKEWGPGVGRELS